MKSIEQMSDDELKKIAAGEPAKIEDLSDEQLHLLAKGEPIDNILNPPPSMLERVGEGIIEGITTVGETIDAYTGAPTRAALAAGLEGKSPVEAFGQQFGSDPKEAPVSKELVQKYDLVPEQPKAAEIILPSGKAVKYEPFSKEAIETALGFIGDIGIDFTNLVPIGFLAKSAIKGTGMAAKGAVRGAQMLGDLAVKGSAKATDFVTGTKAATETVERAGRVTQIAKETAESAWDSLGRVFNPKRAEDWDELKAIAEKNGIDIDLPEAVEFGETSLISRAARVRAEGPLGEKFLEKFNASVQQTKDAVIDRVTRASGGQLLDPVSAGNLIVKGFDNAVDRAFSDLSHTYQGLARALDKTGGFAPSEKFKTQLDGILNRAASDMENAVTTAQQTRAEQVFNALVQLDKAQSAQDFVGKMQTIGKLAFKKEPSLLADIPPDVKQMKELYHMASEAFTDNVQVLMGKDAATKLKDTNKALTKFFGDSSVVARTIETAAPERVFDQLILNGDTKKLEALKGLLTKDEMSALKGAFFERLARTDTDGSLDFAFKSLHNQFRNRRAVVSQLFEPDEIRDIGELLRLGDRMGIPIMSTSGTGASNLLRDIIRGSQEALVNDNMIDILKDVARGKKMPPAPRSEMGAAQAGAIGRRMSMPRRGRLEGIGKGAQVFSTQQNANDERRQFINRLRGQ